MIHSIVQLVALAALGAGLYLVFGVGIALIVLGVLVLAGSIALEARTPANDDLPKDGD